MKSFNRLLICGLLLIGSLFAFEAIAYGQAPGQLTADHVRVRRTPNLDANNILFQVNAGEYVTVLDVAGYYFYRVNVRDYTDVYIFREFVRILENNIEYNEPEDVYDAYEDAHNEENVQEEAQVEAAPYIPQLIDPQLEDLLLGAWALNDYWAYGGAIPYDLVDISDFMPQNTVIDDLLAYAKSYIGTPYRWGSTDPSRGFDCSGFVLVVMRNFGVNLNRSSRDMAANNGVRVERNAMQAGDLVFFATGGGGRVSHVGIYIGGDRFIHSATRGGVMISGMGETYWRARFVRANRVL